MNCLLLEITFVFLFKISFVYLFCQTKFNDRIIETGNGRIKGTQDSNCFLYLGIPYALPPVNDLRWKEPLKAASWSPKILDATNYKSSCPQVSTCHGNLKTECTISVLIQITLVCKW
jgi:hypothetical protein